MNALDNIRIILVEPEFQGNIGSAARALKTMGLSQLWVVNPACEPRGEEAVRLAHNSNDVLQQVRIVDRLEEALAETSFSIATTRRVRRQQSPYFNPEEAGRLVVERGTGGPVAVVFGRESSGLTNPELEMCSVQSTIAAATENQSLNLAQAVMVYTYSIYQASLMPSDRTFQWQLSSHDEQEQFYAHLATTLKVLGARPATTMENYVARFRRVISRMPLESRDVRLLRKVLTRMNAVANGQQIKEE